MAEPRKRAYTSQLRAEQARRTRKQIVDAAAALFAERGYGATTIDAVAEAAGVSRKTVFTSVGGKVELIKLAYDFAIAGDDAPEPMVQREAIRALQAEPDPRKVLTAYAALVTEIDGRITPVYVALAGAAQVDPDAAALFEELQRQRLDAMRMPAAKLRDDLRPGLSVERAADILWLHNDPSLYDKLVRQRGWTPAQFRDWLAEALCDQLVGTP
ncbi:TetR/AcrR family transcriptional regulator [Nonomuraea sediminis]|uniref:TetR/AcrR family transcriptional regulator n=1 Tax=Nonomuraea sediminis TaxID=2835864 RepID=UPI001BDD0DF3|nr:TetR/AcrR family transcriptional regulator [Nonomuraea sediminis]